MPYKLSLRTIVLSKSKFNAGLSCPKLLWCMFNAPDKIPPIDEGTQAIFDQGHEVGNLAKQLHPEGKEIPFGKGALELTQDLLKKRVPIFEASFSYKNAYCKT